MKNSIIQNFENSITENSSKVHPVFRPGDAIRVHYKIEEQSKSSGGEKKYRIQVFEGVCIRYKKGELQATFTVRKIGANSVGVERIFSLYSPLIDKIEISAPGDVRRSRLYYLRELTGKAARIRARRLPSGYVTSSVDKAQGETVAKAKKK